MKSASPLKPSKTRSPAMWTGASIKREFQVFGSSGLTMLRCSQLIDQFGDFSGSVTISNGAISVDGRSMIDLLQLAAVTGTVLTVELTGREPEKVMQRIESLLDNPS